MINLLPILIHYRKESAKHTWRIKLFNINILYIQWQMGFFALGQFIPSSTGAFFR